MSDNRLSDDDFNDIDLYVGRSVGISNYGLLKVIEVSGRPLEKFDIGWVDASRRRYYLADRSNARVIVIDTERLTFIAVIGDGCFTGAAATGSTSGPNGVMVLDEVNELWAGDGDSTIKVFDLASGTMLDIVNTGGAKRVDEMAYDPVDHVVLAANDAEPVPFVSLVAAQSTRKVQKRISLHQASRGLHQPVWDAATQLFYVPVTEVNGDPSKGEIVKIDPETGLVVGAWPVRECQPAGLALGPEHRLCVGCSKNAVDAGFAPKTLVLDTLTGSVVQSVREVGGSDEVWYDNTGRRYYLAAFGMLGGPVLGIVDADTNQWIENVITGESAHSVAVDPHSHHAFVPLTPSDRHPNGGIGVFGPKVS